MGDMIDVTAGARAIQNRVGTALCIGVPALIFLAFAWRIFGGTDPAERFNDDFFYYVVPAGNWVDGAGSTFFPNEPTNGYHPLWFLWIAALFWFTGDGLTFFALVDLTLAVLVVGFFFLFQRFLSRVTGDRLAAIVGSAVATILMAVIAKSAVEAALAVFAAALLLDYLSRKPLGEMTIREAAVAGLLGAFLVLARLDAAILVLGLAVVILPHWDLRRWAAAMVGAAPLYVYLVFNVMAFGHISTASAEAKSLEVYWPPNVYFLGDPWPIVAILVVLVAIALGFMLQWSENVDARRIALALTAAPIVQLVAQAFLSGWALFPWYFYFFLMALGLAAALVFARVGQKRAWRLVGIPLGVVIFIITPFVLVVGVTTPDPWQAQIATIAKRLQAFSVNHPGTYAMGDAAGTAEWLVGQPMVHLEGLMMSHDFLNHISERQPLEQVLRDYAVNYYVAVRDDGTGDGGCLRFAEPNSIQASPRAPYMSMTICTPPIEMFTPGARYDEVRIYRIDPSTGKAI